MVLSKRERYIAAIALGAIALLVLDRYLVSPGLDRWAQLQVDRQQALERMERATALFARRGQIGRQWNDLLAGGLNTDPANAERIALHALRDWAQRTGLSISSVKPERQSEEGELREIEIDAVAVGPMSAVGQFLWHVETAQFPMRIRELQLGSKKDGLDDLSLTLKLSLLYFAPEEAQDGREGRREPNEGDGA